MDFDTTNLRVGIGTTSPNQQLELTKNLRVPATTYNSGNQYGIIYKDGNRFIHDFNYGNNGAVTTVGYNTFVGVNAGNFSAGETATQTYHASYNTGTGYQSLYSNTTGYYNTVSGYQILYSNTTGSNNSAVGMQALYSNTIGYNNSAIGYQSLYYNTSGFGNTAMGMTTLVSNTEGTYNTATGLSALYSNTTGSSNLAAGMNALYSNTTGTTNAAVGYQALYYNTSGSNNVAAGYNAGTYISGGAIANQTSGTSIYLGDSTKALADGDSNEIVIGYNATGVGSNSAVLGNDSITKTILKGNVGIGGTTTPAVALDITQTSGAGTNKEGLVVRETAGGGYIYIGYENTGTYGFIGAYDGGLRNVILAPEGGNVGIGTTSPSVRLSLGASLGNELFKVYDAGAGLGYGLGIQSNDFRFFVNDSGADFNFYPTVASASPVMTIKGNSNVGIGTATGFGTSAAKVFSIGEGTAPTTFPTDVSQLWSANAGGRASRNALHIADENGTVSILGTAKCYHDYLGAHADWTLTTSEMACQYIQVLNADAGVNAILPSAVPGRMYTIENKSGQTLTFKVTGGTGGSIANGKGALYTTLSTDVYEVWEQP
jgi:hypothetical protein